MQSCDRGLWSRMGIAGLRGVVALALTVAASAPAWGCPGCKESLAAQGGDLAAGYNYSILFMMGMPFLLLGAGSLAMVLSVRRARAAGFGAAHDDPFSAARESVGA